MSGLGTFVVPSSIIRTQLYATYPTHNHAPPIFKLDSEVLWYIFSITAINNDPLLETITVRNPDMSRASALVTTRHLSQVCAVWRELVLASSSIWASSIELNYLDQTLGHWREEVVRRTGKAPLSIMGKVKRERPSTHFFLDLLSNEWPRIRRLNIIITSKVTHDCRWLALDQPTCNLELLHISFFSTSHPSFLAAESIPFSNNPPKLHSLRLKDIHFNLDMPWISQLRELGLRKNFTPHTIFRALRDMLTLEVLALEYMDMSDSNFVQNDWTAITLPRLKRLIIYDTFYVSNSLLQHIVPPAACSLFLEIAEIGTPNVTPEDLSALSQSLLGYFNSYSAHTYGKNCLSLIVTRNVVILDNLRSDSRHTSPSHPRFRLVVEINFPEAPYAIACTIFRVLSSCNLSMITTSHLDLADFDVVEPASQSDLYSLMKALSRVEVLQTKSETLGFLFSIQDNRGPILPSLQTIVFEKGCEVKCGVVARFLIQRCNAKVPIKVLYLKKSSSLNETELLFLKGIGDLEVKLDDGFREGDEKSRRGD